VAAARVAAVVAARVAAVVMAAAVGARGRVVLGDGLLPRRMLPEEVAPMPPPSERRFLDRVVLLVH
jgi:hypothetical protein